jgi:hypothetical protein
MYCAASRSVTNGFPARHHDRIGKALIPRHQSYALREQVQRAMRTMSEITIYYSVPGSMPLV